MKKKLKKIPKKVIRRRRRKATAQAGHPAITYDLENFYKIINKVQTSNQPVNILVPAKESAVFNNILKDLELIITQSTKVLDNQEVVEYSISPNPKKEEEKDFEDMEAVPDEFFEDGQLFGI